MKFLVDECVGHSVATWLKQNNFDAISIYDSGLQGTTDNEILKKAHSESRILITSDKDFGEMIFRNKMLHNGVILLRIPDERPSSKIKIIQQVIHSYARELEGNFVVATESSIRITKLTN